MKIYIKNRFLLNLNHFNNSNDLIRVLAYFQLIKILNSLYLLNPLEFFLAVFDILSDKTIPVISSDFNAC